MQNIVYLGVGEIKKLEYPLFSWANLYMDIKYELIQNGYAWEIDWQEDLNLDKVDECFFLKELAWVILNSGMRETVIKNIFPKISNAFYDWESAYTIQLNSIKCFQKAISIFNN